MDTEKITERLTEEIQCGELADMIVEAASEYFKECPEDFCVQSVGFSYIIFGGTNRLIWSPEGFSPDVSYCTQKFLQHYHKLSPDS